MKKHIAGFLIFVLIISLYPYTFAAESYDYLIEAENYTSSNFAIQGGTVRISDSNSSGGQYIGVYTNSSNAPYYAEYSVSVSTAGVYDLFLASSPVRSVVSSIDDGRSSWCSRIYLSVNGGEVRELVGTKQSSTANSRIGWYSVGGVNLSSGSNTIRFIVKDRLNSNYYSAFFDCFGLKKSSFGLRYIASETAMNVFEGGERVSLSVNANATASSNQTFAYTVSNVYGNTVRSGNVTINQGASKTDLVLQNLDFGCYYITIGGLTSGFSVVKPLSERTMHSDTPFAIDTAFSNSGQWGVNAKDYARVLGLSGVSWIRDRLWFKNFVTYSDGEYTMSNGNQKEAAELLRPYGIKISTATDYMPSNFVNTYGKYIPDDLVKSYNFWKTVGQKYGAYIDNFEIFNEVDYGGTVGSMDSPDLYAAFMKAAAIGINDGSDSMVSTQGEALYITDKSEYTKMLMRNGVLDYSAFDNAHYHIAISGSPDDYYEFEGNDYLPEQAEAQKKLAGSREPIWVTEAGISFFADSGIDLTQEEQRVQAKYLVTSSVESIANGTDKHFFFFGPRYHQGEVETSWGMMNEDTFMQYMYASYSAQAAMTDLLGQGRYKGKLSTSNSNVCAYLFNNGVKDVIVAWSKSGSPTVAFNANGKQYDMWGNEKATVNGSTSITLTAEPLYIVCDSNFEFPTISRDTQLIAQKKEITDAKRIVLLQKYSDVSRGGSRLDGYMISDGNNTVTLEVANLSDKTVTGQIGYKTENGWKLDKESVNVTVSPMSVETVSFTITPADGATVDYLSFIGTFNGQTTSPSTAKLVKTHNGTITVEAETAAKSKTGFNEYTRDSYKGLEILTSTVKTYKIELDVMSEQSGVYDLWALASLLNHQYASNFVIEINGKELTPSSKTPASPTNSDVLYWAPHNDKNPHPVAWNSFNDVRLKKGKNSIVVSVSTARNSDNEYICFALDKLVFVPKGLVGYREAENYTAKKGMYLTQNFPSASSGQAVELFTYGIENPVTDNELSYDFAVNDSGKYDVWVLSTKANATHVTKWKIGVDETPVYPTIAQTVSGGSIPDMGSETSYWYKVKNDVSLKRGIHNVSVAASEKRANNDYMLHRIDAVVVVKETSSSSSTSGWTPVTYGGNIYVNKYNVLKKVLLSEYDLTNITESITLPKEIEGAKITWTSSNPSVVSTDGVVNRPDRGSSDVAVTLTAGMRVDGGSYAEQAYSLTVKAVTDSDRTPELSGELINSEYGYSGIQLYGKNTDLLEDTNGKMPAAVVAKYSRTTGEFLGLAGNSSFTYTNLTGDSFTVKNNRVTWHITGVSAGNSVKVAVYREGIKPGIETVAYVNEFHPTEDNGSIDFSFTNNKGAAAYRVVINKNGTVTSNIIHIFGDGMIEHDENDTQDDIWIKQGVGQRITSTKGEMTMPLWVFNVPENEPDVAYKAFLWAWDDTKALVNCINLTD